MKILSVGNSFSYDAHKWLHSLAELHGIYMETANLFIGGCSLERHWNNVLEDLADYDYQLNGNEENTVKKSIYHALTEEKWDIITLQQASALSGIEKSYEPYLKNLYNYIKDLQPQAKIYFHQTWAYETDSLHEGFCYYNFNQTEMFEKIITATEKASSDINAPIIPTGKVIQHLRRNTADFDYENGGLSLCRDGFHLSYDYGRYSAACVWLRTLTGTTIEPHSFRDFDKKQLSVINELINRIL